jgi:hypothetical protein
MADNAAKEEIQNEKVGRKEPSLQAHGRRCKGA